MCGHFLKSIWLAHWKHSVPACTITTCRDRVFNP